MEDRNKQIKESVDQMNNGLKGIVGGLENMLTNLINKCTPEEKIQIAQEIKRQGVDVKIKDAQNELNQLSETLKS